MKKIILAPNPLRDLGLIHTKAIKQKLEAAGITPQIYPLNHVTEERIEPADTAWQALSDALSEADRVITLGGDGTILHIARIAAPYAVPILTINLGRKGFMAELAPEELDKICETVTAEHVRCEDRMMIDVEVTRDKKVIYEGFALNDVVAKGMARSVDFSVFGDGHLITRFSGDGIIVSTPTGSTAYSMAAGGPIIEPTAQSLTVTPICAHALQAKSFVLAPEREVTVQIILPHGKQGYLSVDGGNFHLEDQDKIRIARSRHITRLIKASHLSFYQVVSEKLREGSP